MLDKSYRTVSEEDDIIFMVYFLYQLIVNERMKGPIHSLPLSLYKSVMSEISQHQHRHVTERIYL